MTHALSWFVNGLRAVGLLFVELKTPKHVEKYYTLKRPFYFKKAHTNFLMREELIENY